MTPRAHPFRRVLPGIVILSLAIAAASPARAQTTGADTTSEATARAWQVDSAGAFVASTARAGIGAFRADRLQHASLALAIGVGAGIAAQSPAAGAGTAVTLALAKEILDDRFDRGDLLASVVGAAIAWWVVDAVTR